MSHRQAREDGSIDSKSFRSLVKYTERNIPILRDGPTCQYRSRTDLTSLAKIPALQRAGVDRNRSCDRWLARLGRPERRIQREAVAAIEKAGG